MVAHYNHMRDGSVQCEIKTKNSEMTLIHNMGHTFTEIRNSFKYTHSPQRPKPFSWQKGGSASSLQQSLS